MTCPNCGAEVTAGESFCEACGTTLTLAPADGAPPATSPEPASASSAPALASPLPDDMGPDAVGPGAIAPDHIAADDVDDDLLESPINLTVSTRPRREETEPTVIVPRPCPYCGGPIGAEGYCDVCGAKAPKERDHYTEEPAPWVAAVCDRGVRHHRNEDATAISAEAAPGSRAVLVVCDGVSTAPDSDVASLAAARTARDLLTQNQPAGMGVPASRTGALIKALEEAAVAANQAVIASDPPAATRADAPAQDAAANSAGDPGASSCTFVAAVVEGPLVVFGNIGDSRAYWLPDGDGSGSVQLSTDDSVAQERMMLGVPREEAENGPQAHAITRWLGRDAPEIRPHSGAFSVAAPGWLLVCSDGLWNYASTAAEVHGLLSAATATSARPLDIADALVTWACEQGGKDNISVALARLTP